MRKSTISLIIDTCTLLIFAGLAGTGILIKYRLPPGSGGGGIDKGHGAIGGTPLYVWDLSRHQWGSIHFILALVLLALIAIHIIDHWQWIRVTAKGHGTPSGGFRKAFMIVAAAISLALIVMPFLLTPKKRIAMSPASASPTADTMQIKGPLPEGKSDEAELIYGALTIDELAQRTNLSVNQIQALLGVKDSLRGDEKLGRLLRSEGISMQEARRRLNLQETGLQISK